MFDPLTTPIGRLLRSDLRGVAGIDVDYDIVAPTALAQWTDLAIGLASPDHHDGAPGAGPRVGVTVTAVELGGAARATARELHHAALGLERILVGLASVVFHHHLAVCELLVSAGVRTPFERWAGDAPLGVPRSVVDPSEWVATLVRGGIDVRGAGPGAVELVRHDDAPPRVVQGLMRAALPLARWTGGAAKARVEALASGEGQQRVLRIEPGALRYLSTLGGVAVSETVVTSERVLGVSCSARPTFPTLDFAPVLRVVAVDGVVGMMAAPDDATARALRALVAAAAAGWRP